MPKRHDVFLLWFGARVRSIRLAHKISQEELAQIAGLDRTYVGGIERGERNLSLLNIKKIADALKVKPKEFFEDAI